MNSDSDLTSFGEDSTRSGPIAASDAIQASIARIKETIAQRQRDFEALLPTIPQSIPCRVHADVLLPLDLPASRNYCSPRYSLCRTCSDEAEDEKRREKQQKAGIPNDVRHASLDNFILERKSVRDKTHTPADFLAAAMMFRARECRNLVLCGSTGIGKGHLAAALVNDAISAGKTNCRWLTCSKMFALYHAAYADNANEDLMWHWVNCHYLVIDELCLREMPKDGEEILWGVIDGRMQQKRQTILLGNKSGKAVREWLGERVYDRLKSGGVEFRYGEWDSMRSREQGETEF